MKVAFLKAKDTGDEKYFLRTEYMETLSKTKAWDPRAIREQRPEYTYKCSGAKYDGEWAGGFRDGFGKLLFSDGASYEGNWVFGQAEGQGKFVHIDGDYYEG